MLDAVIGLGLVAAMLGVLTVALSRHQETAEVLEAERVAVNRAEAALTRLQSGEAIEPSESSIQLEALSTEPPREGWVWVRLEASRGEGKGAAEATLTGVVPRSALESSRQ